MGKAFIYWDNSNIHIAAQEAAAQREGDDARFRVRLHFSNLLELARAGREIEHAVAVGSVPPELRHVWNRLEGEGVAVCMPKGGPGRWRSADSALQTALLRDALDHKASPGTAVLLTGDGTGFQDGAGFQADLERMHRRGWEMEVLSWRHSCRGPVREWAERVGRFAELDDFYESVTFLEPPRPGHPIGSPRHAVPVGLAKRLSLS